MSDLIAHYWYIGAFAIAAIVFFTEAKTAIAAAKKTIANFRLRLLFFVSDQLEPDTIADFRRSIAKTLSELSDFLEKSELELLRSRMNNVFFKDKIQELEQNREALLQELGGSSDSLNIEFSILKQMFHTIDLLVNDRLALLQKIELFNSYDNNSGSLLEEIIALKGKNQTAAQRIKILYEEGSVLQARNEQLSQNLEAKLNELQGLVSEIIVLRKTIVGLEQSESTLQQQIFEIKQRNSYLEQQNYELKIENRKSIAGTSELENLTQRNIDLHEINESLTGEIECMRNELVQKEAQVQNLLMQSCFSESDQSLTTNHNSDVVIIGDHRLIRKVARLRKYLRQATEQLWISGNGYPEIEQFMEDEKYTND